MPPMPRPSNPFLAALLSALVPGAGQWYAGARRRARPYLLITIGLVVPAAFLYLMIFYVSGLGLAITLSRPFFEHPTLLGVLLVANALLLVFRAVAVVDAYLLARRSSTQSRSGGVMAVGLAALLFLTALPHGWVGERNLLLYDLMTHDFSADPGQVPLDQVTSTTAGEGGTTSSQVTTTTLSDAFPEAGRVNVLLMGGDAGVDREGIRTDTMIVVSIDPETGWTAMLGIPRNLTHIPIPSDHPATNAWDSCDGCFPLLANQVYEWGLVRPDLFGGPNSGGNSMKVIMGHLLGIDIHYFALVDLEGFIEIIDAIGGVDITVTARIYDTEYPNPDGTFSVIDLQPGEYHMDGEMALYYTRSRQGSNDFDRMNRQRCLLEAIAAQTDPVTAIRQFPTLVPAIESSVITDVPVSVIPDFIGLLEKVNVEEVVSIRFMPDAPEFAGTPTSYIGAWTDDRFPIPDREFIAATVDTALSLPPLQAIEQLNLQPIDDVCGSSG